MLRDRRALLAVLLLALIFVGALAANRDQPLVRNSLVYARAAWNVAAAGGDPRPVVADSHRSYDKPIGFAWAAAPLVTRLGAHDGLRGASLVGALAYLLATLAYARTVLPPTARGRAATVVVLAAFGPLAIYQEWSAHPDGAFAALVLVALTLTLQLGRDAREAAVPRRALLLLATLLAAFLLKNYALVLLPACALDLTVELRAQRRAGISVARRAAWSGAALLVFALFAAAARFGWNPLSRLEGEGGGAEQFAPREILSISWKTLAQCGLALALQFHVTLAALPQGLRRGAEPAIWRRPLLTLGVPYVAGLLAFPTAFYNMRYFLPLFPLVAVAVVQGLAHWPARARVAAFGVFLLVNGATALVFDSAPLFDAVRARLPDLTVRWLTGGPPLSLLDNLRMAQHRDVAAWLATINAEVAADGELDIVDAYYYRDAQQTVFERDGRLRADLRIRYVAHDELAAVTTRRWIAWAAAAPSDLARLGRVTDLGHHVFRVDPEGSPAAPHAPPR